MPLLAPLLTQQKIVARTVIMAASTAMLEITINIVTLKTVMDRIDRTTSHTSSIIANQVRITAI